MSWLDHRFSKGQTLLDTNRNERLFFFASAGRKIKLLTRSIRLFHESWNHVDPVGGQKYTFAYLGEGTSLEYLKKLYHNCGLPRAHAKLPCLSLARTCEDLQLAGKYTFVELNTLIAAFLPYGFRTFPWVGQRVYLNDKSYTSRKRQIGSNFGRIVRKFKYSFQISSDLDDITEFYKTFYAPYIRQRFGDAAVLTPAQRLIRNAQRGFLIKVYLQKTWVSGAVCVPGKDAIRIFYFGLLADYLKRGALAATYYFIFRWAEENSLRMVDLFSSRPHQKDGVFLHKSRWGAKAERYRWPSTMLSIVVPESGPLPSSLAGHLVWSGKELLPLGQLIPSQ